MRNEIRGRMIGSMRWDDRLEERKKRTGGIGNEKERKQKSKGRREEHKRRV